LCLIGGQPVAKPHSQFLYTLDSPYPGGQVCGEEPAIGRLVRETAHSSEAKVDRTWSEIPGFQMHSVPEGYSFAERQPRLGTIPIHEFVDRVPVPALGIGTGKAVEDSGFRDFKVWQPQHRFGGPSFGIALLFLLHYPWPPSPRVDHAPADTKLGPVCGYSGESPALATFQKQISHSEPPPHCCLGFLVS
jgi:hypothetical protein